MRRELDIDFLKALAIIAVLMDHFRGLYDNALLANASYFSVTVFIVLAGITRYPSLERFYGAENPQGIAQYLMKACKSLLCTYVLASSWYYLMYSNNRIDDIAAYFVSLASFNCPTVCYYVVMYIELLLLSPILYALIRKAKKTRFPAVMLAILLALTLFVGYYFTLHGPFFLFYGGSAYFLTGSYLFLYTLGMVFSAEGWRKRILSFKYANLLVLPVFLWAGWRIVKGDGPLRCSLHGALTLPGSSS